MKLSKRTIIIAVSALLIIGGGVGYYFATKDKSEVKSWSDSNWLFRKSVAISNTSGGTLLNEDVLLTIDSAALVSAGKLQSNCNDFRFTDSDNSTYLQYWIEDGCNTTSTKIWVRIPSLPSDGKTIYMYYGNSTTYSAQENWGGHLILLADATCPTGWTRDTNIDSKFPYGGSSYGLTGGANSHGHGVITGSTDTVLNSTTSASLGFGLGVLNSHIHTNFSTSIDSSTVLPPYLNMLYCDSTSFTIPTGLISVFESTVPTGWTRFSALDNYFPQGASTYGGTGGSTTHTHTTTNSYITDAVTSGYQSPVQLDIPSGGTDSALSVAASTTVNINTANNSASGRSCSQGGDAVNYSVTALSSNSATISSTLASGCLSSGDEVLLINLQGTSSYYTNVGNYETLKVASASGTTVTFTTNKTKYYGNGSSDDTNIGTASTNQRVMLQRVPQYSDVTIGSGATLTANAWDGTKGGVLYFNASGTVTNNGTISMDSKGYIGGARTTGANAGIGGEAFCANPGGGGGSGNGVCGGGGAGGISVSTGGTGSSTGGAGGAGGLGGGDPVALGGGGGGGGYGSAGNAGSGSYSGTNGGDNTSGNGGAASGSQGRGGGGGGGGTYGTSSLSKLNFGSGGASGGATWGGSYGGIGGTGGGIIYITANTFTNGGSGVVSRGMAGGSGSGSGNYITGAGGGGAGGAIRIDALTASLGSGLVVATGGSGGTNGYGGGAGGSGRIAISYTSSISGSSSPSYTDNSSTVSSIATSDHTHTSTSTTVSTEDNTPPYINVIFGKNDATKYVTNDNVLLASAFPPLGWNRVTAFDNKFIRGSSTFGATGGSETHSHTITISSGGPSATVYAIGSGTSFASGVHTHSFTTTTTAFSNNPAYISVIYIQRKVSQTTTIGSVEETLNVQPNAPTGLYTEGLTNPTDVLDDTPEFSAVFTDPDTTDTGNYYRIQVNTNSTFTGTAMWESTKTALSPVVANGARSQDISYAGSPLQLGATYYWRIKFWDNGTYMDESDWSATAQFTMNGSTAAPSNPYCQGTTNPTKVMSANPTFSAIFNDPNTSDTGIYYRIEVNTNDTFTGTVMWSSSKASMTTVANGARSQDFAYSGSTLQAGTKYYWHMKFWDNTDIEGPWSPTATFTMDGNPTAPTNLQVNDATNPTYLYTLPPYFTAKYSDPNEDSASAYQIQVNMNDTFTSTVMWDSGKTSTTVLNNQTSPHYNYNGVALSSSSHILYWRIKFWDSDDHEGAWSDVGHFTDSYSSFQFNGLGLNGIKLN